MISAVRTPVIVVAGPTASGKSGLALSIAEEFGGAVINADSMQIYKELSVVTARPGIEDEAKVPHRLYGDLAASDMCTVARWRDMALDEIARCRDENLVPVVCGGTGMYIRALMQGISEIPPIPEDIRRDVRQLHSEIGGAALRKQLAEKDPVTAARLYDGDSQRLMRAFEVVQATGKPISAFQAGEDAAPEHLKFSTFVLLPDRAELYRRCDERFAWMVENGALEEVEALVGQNLSSDLPAMKALGVPEIAQYLAGDLSKDAMIELASQGTRRYAKRQMTWFRNQMKPGKTDLTVINAQLSESVLAEIFMKIRQFLLT